MLQSKLILCLGIALLGTACNHENDRTMTPANGSTMSDPPQSGPDPAGTPTGDSQSNDSGSGTPGSGSGTTGSGSGTTGSGSGTTGSGSGTTGSGSGTTGSGSGATGSGSH
jgi:hypothetical protein